MRNCFSCPFRTLMCLLSLYSVLHNVFGYVRQTILLCPPTYILYDDRVIVTSHLWLAFVTKDCHHRWCRQKEEEKEKEKQNWNLLTHRDSIDDRTSRPELGGKFLLLLLSLKDYFSIVLRLSKTSFSLIWYLETLNATAKRRQAKQSWVRETNEILMESRGVHSHSPSSSRGHDSRMSSKSLFGLQFEAVKEMFCHESPHTLSISYGQTVWFWQWLCHKTHFS